MSKDIFAEALPIPCWLLSEHDVSRLVSEKPGSASAVAKVVAKADTILPLRAESVVEKTPVPPSGDKRDYMSLAIYVWPDPDMPDGLPYKEKDGIINPEIHDYDLPRFWRMATRVETLALAYLHTGVPAYADKAAEMMRVWFLDEATGMNPHLDFGQFVPGKCDGRCYGIIETTGLMRVVNAVRILDAAPDFEYADGPRMREWFARYAKWLATSELGIGEANTTNNHRVWHTAQLAGYLLFGGKADAARDLLGETIPAILQQQMAPDGSMPRELARTRSFHYTAFVLTPLLMCVDMGKALGLDLAAATNEAGASIRTGIEWFLPYLAGEREWTWEQITDDSPFEEVYPPLRMAANVLGEPAYEAVLENVAGDDYGQLCQDLILPKATI